MNNPFRYSSNPYRDNPFSLLGLDDPAVPAERISLIVDLLEEQQGTGEARRAERAISDPVTRLAFDLIHFGLSGAALKDK